MDFAMLAPVNNTPLYQSPESLVPILPSQYADTAKDPYIPPQAASGGHDGPVLFGEEEPSFWDLLDIVNPLQHIPIVGAIYRDITGDKIGGLAKMAGGFLFGGPIGAAAAAVDTTVLVASGKDLGSHTMALFSGDSDDDSKTMLADAQKEPPAPTASPRTKVTADPLHFDTKEQTDIPVSAAPAPVVANTAPTSPMALPPTATALGVTPQTQAAAQAAIAQILAEEQSKATQTQVAQAATTATTVTANDSKPIATKVAAPKFMPAPERVAVEPKPIPAVTAGPGVANYNGVRVNPRTALEVQRIQAETGANQHPMLGKSADGTPMAADPQWMAAAMMDTLNRYEQKGGNLSPAQSISGDGAAE